MNVCVRRAVIIVLKGLGGLVALFLLLQLVPYGRTHANPDVSQEPAWNSPRTRELAKRACFDCHSNETRWPWYANVAPLSWVVQFDVEAARSVFNFSEWDRPYPLAVYAGAAVREGRMPIFKYKVAHPEADLTPEETRELAQGLELSLRQRVD